MIKLFLYYSVDLSLVFIVLMTIGSPYPSIKGISKIKASILSRSGLTYSMVCRAELERREADYLWLVIVIYPLVRHVTDHTKSKKNGMLRVIAKRLE